jgi:hypothetical protein
MTKVKFNGPTKKRLLHKEGITYFHHGIERSFFFIMTLVMLVLGALFKLGFF